MKTVWISALSKNQPRVAAVSEHLKRYGLQAKGHFWTDEPDKLAWRTALASMLEARADLWLILADNTEMAKTSVRYGLSLLSTALQASRGPGFPIMILWDAPPSVALPPILQAATALEEAAPSWAAKIVAKANIAGKAPVLDYRFEVGGDERLGQWFEIGPRTGNWDGVVFGVTGADVEINFQAVGPQGGLPEKTVIEFAQQGLTLQVGEREFSAWAVRNNVDSANSYYARVKGRPEAILFMPYADESECEATVLQLT